jgi:hypothetical protein
MRWRLLGIWREEVKRWRHEQTFEKRKGNEMRQVQKRKKKAEEANE